MKLVSVIVPVYNAESYLKECVDSILRQSYPEIEVVLINDGSTDNSGKICASYAEQDARVVFIDSANYGVAHARNRGVAVARGEFITFADSDDILSSCLVESLVGHIGEADIAVARMQEIHQRSDFVEPTDNGSGQILSRQQAIRGLLSQRIINGPYAKLFRAPLLQSFHHDGPFQEGLRIGEDLLMNLKVFSKAHKVATIETPLYGYRRHLGNTMNSSRVADRKRIIAELESFEQQCLQAGESVDASSRIFAEALYVVFENSEVDPDTTAVIKCRRDDVIRDAHALPQLKVYALSTYAGFWAPRLLHKFKAKRIGNV